MSLNFSLDTFPITVDRLRWPLAEQRGGQLYLLRLDRIHPLVSGNKWFKLRYNLRQAMEQGAERIISFGGAFSNHLHALAWVGHETGIQTLGVVRGEPEYMANPTLSDVSRWGMQLEFVDRQTYRRRHDPDYHKALLARYPNSFIVPEGGSNALAVQGFNGLFDMACWEGMPPPDLLVSACGSGGTLAGLIAAKPAGTRVLGIPVLKGGEFLYRDVAALLQSAGYDARQEAWTLDLNGHEGGYARRTPDLTAFMKQFQTHTGIELDPVYTGKMMFRLHKLIEQGTFVAGTSIVAVHTGGLQGCRGFN